MFAFIPLGVGDTFSQLHYSSCLLLQAEGSTLLVDCPHPIRKILHETSQKRGIVVDIEDIDAILLSHLHADHCSGIESFAFFSHFLLKKRVQIISHPVVYEDLWDKSLAGGMEQLQVFSGETKQPPPTWEMQTKTFDDFFDIHALSEEHSVTYGPFTIECRKTIHHIPTTAFRIRAAGKCLGYSADTAYDETLIEWLSEADTIIHETNYGTHTPYEKLRALPSPLRDKFKLIHYPDHFDTKGEMEALVEGTCYTV